MTAFPDAAREALRDAQLRHNLGNATRSIRAKRAHAVGELPDWEELRAAGAAAKEGALRRLDSYLVELEDAVTERGGVVHWARDAAEARLAVSGLVPGGAAPAVIASDVTREVGLAGPPPGPGTEIAVVGAGFLVAETGTLVVADEGLAFPRTVVAVAGIEDVVPRWSDLEVLLRLLPQAGRLPSAVSTRTGDLHVVLVDNGRTRALADEAGRAALRCIHCGACRDVCPVYERAGPGPYGPGPGGPIGAVLVPLRRGVEGAMEASLPFASTLCGACADVCPVKIDIPGLLVDLRGRVVDSRRQRAVPTPEALLMRGVAWAMADERRYERMLGRRARWARLFARDGRIARLPGPLGRWTETRDLPVPPRQTFRDWWRRRS